MRVFYKLFFHSIRGVSLALSRRAKKAYKKAEKAKRKRLKRHWLLPQKGDSAKELLSKFITQLAVLVLIGCGVILGNELRITVSTYVLNGNLKDIYNSVVHTGGELTAGAAELIKINPDAAGWITIEGTNIDLPVVQRKAADGNEFYLNHDFNGGNSKAGTVFIDMRAVIQPKKQSENLILYGHNQRDGSMFGELAKYKKDIDFYREHPTVNFSTNYGSNQYKIVGYFITTVLPEQSRDGYVFDYHNYFELDDENTYNAFISQVLNRSLVNTAVDVRFGDEFLTLSTCSNEFEPSRFVVVCRKVRDGESPVVDTASASINTGALEPDYSYIYSK